MTDLLDQAFEAVRRLDPAEQDEIARIVKALAGDEAEPIPLTPDDQAAIALSRAESTRGHFATDAQVAALWAKHGL